MRKVLFTVALLLTACFVSAQVSVVKEAKSLKSKPEEAAKAIFPFCILFMVLSYYVIYTFESSFCWMMGKKNARYNDI